MSVSVYSEFVKKSEYSHQGNNAVTLLVIQNGDLLLSID
jgi:hypothetical protein